MAEIILSEPSVSTVDWDIILTDANQVLIGFGNILVGEQE